MKNNFILFFALIIPIVLYGQQKTIHTEPLSYKQNILEGNYYIPVNGTVKGYYDENDVLVRHGETSTSGKISENGYGGSISANHSANVNYKDGKLDGIMSTSTSYIVKGMGQSVNISFSCNAMFKGNVPDGSWALKLSASGLGYSANGTWGLTFSDGNVSKFQQTQLIDGAVGETYCMDISFTDGIASGRFYRKNDETKLKNGICTNKFIRLTGKITEPESEETAIINDIIAKQGKVNPDDYLESGYYLEEKSFDYFSDLLEYINGNEYADYAYWNPAQTKFQPTPSTCKYYMLKKVKVNYIDAQLAYSIIDETRHKTTAEQSLRKAILDIRSSNKMTYSGVTYDVRRVDKDDILNYTDSVLAVVVKENRIAEEKRKEEERIAEEKRKEEERIAEEKRKEEERQQNEYSEALSNLEHIDKTLCGVLFKKTISKEPIPTKGKEVEAKTYYAIREELMMDKVFQKNSYKALSEADIAAKAKADTFVSVFYALVYKNDYTDSLKKNATELELMSKSECPDVGKAYASYFKSFPFSKSFISYNDLMKYYRTIMQEAKRQTECESFIQTRKTINENTASLKELFTDYKDISKTYSSYISTVDMSWDKEATVQKLQPILDQQKNLKDFINVRKQISSQDKEILASGKKAKNIVKLYTSYLGEQDFAWNQEVTKEKLATVIELQKALLKGLQLNNIEEIEKLVKKQKINSIHDVLKLF